jgi:hypothetical protein
MLAATSKAFRRADALFMAWKPYEFLPMLGTHMAASCDPVVQLRQNMRMIEFLNRPIGVSPEEDLLLQMQGMIAE